MNWFKLDYDNFLPVVVPSLSLSKCECRGRVCSWVGVHPLPGHWIIYPCWSWTTGPQTEGGCRMKGQTSCVTSSSGKGCRLQPPVFRPQPRACQHEVETLRSYQCLPIPSPAVSSVTIQGCSGYLLWLSALVICLSATMTTSEEIV